MHDKGDLATQIRELAKEIGRLKKVVSATKAKQFWSSKSKEEMRASVQFYFREIRPRIAATTIETADIDGFIQDLFTLADKDATTAAYKRVLTNIEKALQGLELESEVRRSDQAIVGTKRATITDVEAKISKTLEELIPATALSYQQVLLDIGDENRVSYRGTATELREILRETLDQLAPDSEVMAGDGFKLEKDKTRPTMKQKARFILKSRGQTSNSIEAPGKSIEAVEEAVASLVRSTYDRGSIETHTRSGLSRPSILQLKMYVDSVLCELLEIHK
jgi:hypothetical protein